MANPNLRVDYEWDMETWQKGGNCHDIIDHHHDDTLRSLKISYSQRPGKQWLDDIDTTHYVLVLVRDTGSDSEGVVDRQWAYSLEGGKLPEFFDDLTTTHGARVPKRFHREIASHQEWAKQFAEPPPFEDCPSCDLA